MSRNSRHILFSEFFLWQPKKCECDVSAEARAGVERRHLHSNGIMREKSIWKIAATTFSRRDKLKTNKHKRNGKQRIHLAYGNAVPIVRRAHSTTMYYILIIFAFIFLVFVLVFVPKRKSAFAMCERDFLFESARASALSRTHYSELTDGRRNLTIYEH